MGDHGLLHHGTRQRFRCTVKEKIYDCTTTGAITIGIIPTTLSRTTAITGAAATTTGATAGMTTAGAGNYRVTPLQATHKSAKEPSPFSGRLLCFSVVVLMGLTF